jgi:hypothetical protein
MGATSITIFSWLMSRFVPGSLNSNCSERAGLSNSPRVGRVFHDPSTIPVTNLHPAGGVGFRAIALPFVVAYVDVGVGGNGTAIFPASTIPLAPGWVVVPGLQATPAESSPSQAGARPLRIGKMEHQRSIKNRGRARISRFDSRKKMGATKIDPRFSGEVDGTDIAPSPA